MCVCVNMQAMYQRAQQTNIPPEAGARQSLTCRETRVPMWLSYHWVTPREPGLLPPSSVPTAGITVGNPGAVRGAGGGQRTERPEEGNTQTRTHARGTKAQGCFAVFPKPLSSEERPVLARARGQGPLTAGLSLQVGSPRPPKASRKRRRSLVSRGPSLGGFPQSAGCCCPLRKELDAGQEMVEGSPGERGREGAGARAALLLHHSGKSSQGSWLPKKRPNRDACVSFRRCPKWICGLRKAQTGSPGFQAMA